MGKKLFKDRAVINNNCYRHSKVKCYLKGQFTQKFEFCHLQLTAKKTSCTAFENKEQTLLQCETKRTIKSKLRARLQVFVCS